MSIDYMMFTVKSNYQYAPQTIAKRYDLYHASMNGLEISKVENMEVWFIRYMHNFKFRVFNETVFAIGTSEHQNSVVGNIMTIVKGDTAWSVMQNINEYTLIPDNIINSDTVVPVDLVIDTFGRLLIADQKVGLIVYSIDNNALFEKSFYYFYDVGGDVTSIALGKLTFSTTALIGAVNGIVEITLGALEAYKTYPSINMYSGGADTYAIQSPSLKFAFVNNIWQDAHFKTRAALTVLDKSDAPYNTTTVAEWGDEYFMPNSTMFYAYAPFAIFEDDFDELLYYYIRSDPDGVRLYTVGIGEKTLKGTISASANITVTAYEKYVPSNSATQTVNLEMIPSGDFTIIQGAGFRPDATPLQHTFEEYLDDSTFQFYVPLNQYFSGANMTYTVVPKDVPKEMTLAVTGAGKISLLNQEEIQGFNPEAYSDLFSGQNWLAAINGQSIYMYYDNSSFDLYATNPRAINTTESQVKKITFEQNTMFVFGYRLFRHPNGTLTDTQDFFIEEYTLNWNGLNFTYTRDPFENDPDFPCDIFKLYQGNLACGDANQVRLYTNLTDGWFELATLDKTTIGNTGPSFDIVDIAFGSRDDNLFIYLADRINGTHIIDLSNINETTNNYPYLANTVATNNEVYALYQDAVNLYSYNYDGSIQAFYTLEPSAPELIKTMGPWNTEAPNWTALTDRFAIIDSPKTRYIYDLWSPVYSSLYYSYSEFDPDCRPSAPSRLDWDQQFFYIQCDSYIYRYQIGLTEGASPKYEPQETYVKLQVDIADPSILNQEIYGIAADITASNGVSNSTMTVMFNIYDFGEFITYNSTNLVVDLFGSNGTATYAYDKETNEISLERFMSGQNLQYSLMINGSSTVGNNTNTVSPAYILPKTEITDTAQGD